MVEAMKAVKEENMTVSKAKEAKEKEAAKQKRKERESEKKRKNSSVKRNSERIRRLRKQRNPLQSELHLAKRLPQVQQAHLLQVRLSHMVLHVHLDPPVNLVGQVGIVYLL